MRVDDKFCVSGKLIADTFIAGKLIANKCIPVNSSCGKYFPSKNFEAEDFTDLLKDILNRFLSFCDWN